jgi:hypothetical protein
MHEISQRLVIATKPGTWEPAGGWSHADLTELRRDAVIAMCNTSVGEDLLDLGGEPIKQRILDVFAERYEGKFPSTAPFFEYLMEAAQDLLRAETQQPAVPKPTPKVAAAPVLTPEQKEKLSADEEARKQHEGKVRQFAFLVKKQLNTRGVNSLKPRCGVVTVIAETGQSYEYSNELFENLWADAVNLGLLTSGGLQ